MRTFIFTGNHGNSHGLHDIVVFLKAALNDGGADARIATSIVPGAWNVVIEHFIEDKYLDEMKQGHERGARYILIGTEPILGGSFNAGIATTHWHYGRRDYWQLRFDNFLKAARMASAVWVLGESMVASYSAVLPGKVVRYLPHGWVDGYNFVRQVPEATKDIDFFFSGTMSDHRGAILGELAQHHSVVHVNSTIPDYIRFDLLARTKVCLGIRISERNTLPSVSRMHFLLQSGNYLLQESYDEPCPLDPFVLRVDPQDFVQWARDALQLTNRREFAEKVLQGFREALPMSRIVPPLLAQALHAEAGEPAGARGALQPARV